MQICVITADSGPGISQQHLNLSPGRANAEADPRSIAVATCQVAIDQGSGLVFVSEQPSFVPV